MERRKTFYCYNFRMKIKIKTNKIKWNLINPVSIASDVLKHMSASFSQDTMIIQFYRSNALWL